ncbi:PTS system fructose/mannitol-specific IIA component [Companilactobacillus farciminis]|jgi:PTS system fructose-specific IIA component|nr:PTS system fructose/mannitol-specific IIA component [Companilactobacillus farciminis]
MSEELSDFISEKNVVMDLDAKTQDDAIKQLSEILKENGNVSDADDFYKDVLKRESMTTTGIGNNIAIPHGKSDAVTDTTMLFAKNKTPLEWNSLDGSKVNIIFLMAVSPDAIGNAHLKMLAKLSGKLMDDDFVSAIKNAKTTNDILKIIKK